MRRLKSGRCPPARITEANPEAVIRPCPPRCRTLKAAPPGFARPVSPPLLRSDSAARPAPGLHPPRLAAAKHPAAPSSSAHLHGNNYTAFGISCQGGAAARFFLFGPVGRARDQPVHLGIAPLGDRVSACQKPPPRFIALPRPRAAEERPAARGYPKSARPPQAPLPRGRRAGRLAGPAAPPAQGRCRARQGCF